MNNLDTINTIRVAAFFVMVLILISVYWPVYGLPFSILWAGIVIWQWRKQRKNK